MQGQVLCYQYYSSPLMAMKHFSETILYFQNTQWERLKNCQLHQHNFTLQTQQHKTCIQTLEFKTWMSIQLIICYP